MLDADMPREELLAELAALRSRIAEPEETVEAIRRGEVDAFVVLEAGGERVYTLGTAELLRQLRLITESLPVLAAYVGRDRRYHYTNQRYEAWFGLPLDQITGRLVAELMGEAAWAAMAEHVDAALAGRPVTYEGWQEYRGAGARCVHAHLVPHVHEGEVLGFVSFVEDVSERRRAEGALRLLADAGKLLSDPLGGGEVLAVLTDAARLVVPAFADWSTIDLLAEDGSRRRVSAGAAAAGQAEPAAAAAGGALEALVRESEQAALLPDGSRLCAPLLAGGRVLGMWSFGYAASGRRYREDDKDLARELALRVAAAVESARLYRELEAANRAKDRFLATLSHELRTPLTPVLAMAGWLELQDLPGSVRKGLGMMRRNVELEARLIDDLLDLTRIGRGKLELHSERTDLRQVIGQALETLDERQLTSRRLVQDLAAPDHAIWGDRSRLIQVFWNLLSNALKFTPAGGTIRVRSYVEEPPPAAAAGQPVARRLAVEVSDSGIGIEAAVLANIFNAFDQGGEGTSRRYGGLGLGLAISRAIVEQHGGSLTAASEGRDRGARFVVRLQLAGPAAEAAPDAACAPAQGARPAAGAAGRPLNLLLVEDHADTAEALAHLLRAAGHRVAVAPSGAAALAAAEGAAQREPFDLVICDLNLPDGDGGDLMRVLASRHRLRGIALSGYGMEEDLARSREAGFDLHLTKPVSLETLHEAIRRVAGTAGAAGAAGAKG